MLTLDSQHIDNVFSVPLGRRDEYSFLKKSRLAARVGLARRGQRGCLEAATSGRIILC